MSAGTRGPDPMIDDNDLIELVSECEQRWNRPFVTSTDLADHVGMSRQAIHRRLDNLHEEGRIKKYKPGRGAIWWVEQSQQASD